MWGTPHKAQCVEVWGPGPQCEQGPAPRCAVSEAERRRRSDAVEQVTLTYSNPMGQVSKVLSLLAQPTSSEHEPDED